MATACDRITNAAVTTVTTGKDAVCALAYYVEQVVEVTCTWLKPSQGFKQMVVKPLNIAYKITVEYGIVVGQQLQALFAAAKVTKPLINLTDAVSKIPDLFKTYSYSVFRSQRENDQTPAIAATGLEQGLKTGAKLCDWTISLWDMQEALGDFKFVNLSADWIQTTMTVMRFAAGFFALYNIAEELTKIFYTHTIVNQENGTLYEMQAADYMHSVIKIVMGVAYLGMAIMGASLAFQIVTTSLTITNHFFKQIAIREDVRKLV